MFPKKSLFIIFAWIFSIIFTLLFGPKVIKFFQPLLIGLIISLVLIPIANKIENNFNFINKKHSTFIVTFLLLGIFVLVIYFSGSFISKEIVSFIKNLPEIITKLELDINNLLLPINNIFSRSETLKNFSFELPEMSVIIENISTLSTSFIDFGKNLPDFFIKTIFTLMFAFFFTLYREDISNLFKKFIDKKSLDDLFYKLKNILGGYISAQIKLLGITMIIVFIGFLLMNMEYAFLLSIFVAVLDMLPFFGTGTFLGPYAIIQILNGNYDMAIWAGIIYIITFVVRRVLEPKFIGNGVGVSSFFSLFCMYIGYKICGLLGLIIGVPVGVILLYLFKLGAFNSLINSIKDIFNWSMDKTKKI